MEGKRKKKEAIDTNYSGLTPWLWFSPIPLNSNSSSSPVRLAILLPERPAPAPVIQKRNKIVASQNIRELRNFVVGCYT